MNLPVCDTPVEDAVAMLPLPVLNYFENLAIKCGLLPI